MKVLKIVVFGSIVVLPVVLSSCGSGKGTADTPIFSEHIVDDNAHGTASIHSCDVDNDGDIDLLGAVLEDSAMVYWRNDGGTPIAWTRVTIDGNFPAAISVYSADVDGDGDCDVLGAAGVGDEIALWRNDGGTPIVWTRQTLSRTFDFAHEVYAHDLDMDGDIDVLAASTHLNRLAWWRNDGGSPIAWSEQIVDSNFVQAKSVRVADFDRDGDVDIVGAALRGNEVAWWRNEGGNPIRWTKFTIDGDFEGAHRVQAVDMDDDGDADVLAAAYGDPHEPFEGHADRGHMIAWWRNDGGDPIAWEKQVIGKNFERACIAHAADLDGDGDKDVVGTAQEGNEVAWWRNDGGTPIVWTKRIVDGDFKRVWPLHVVDLDRDGDQDIVAGSGFRGTNTVKWWENGGKP
jgi:hypothetical protein